MFVVYLGLVWNSNCLERVVTNTLLVCKAKYLDIFSPFGMVSKQTNKQNTGKGNPLNGREVEIRGSTYKKVHILAHHTTKQYFYWHSG